MIDPTKMKQIPDSEPGRKLELVAEDPDGSFFDLDSIYFRPSLDESRKFNGKHTVHVIFGVTEARLRETNPERYDEDFVAKYERAMAKRMEFRDGDERRYRLELDGEGKKVEIPIPLDTLPDINDFAFDVYDRLDAMHSPLIKTLEQVREEALLVGDEYATALRLCMLIAAEGLPPIGE